MEQRTYNIKSACWHSQPPHVPVTPPSHPLNPAENFWQELTPATLVKNMSSCRLHVALSCDVQLHLFSNPITFTLCVCCLLFRQREEEKGGRGRNERRKMRLGGREGGRERVERWEKKGTIVDSFPQTFPRLIPPVGQCWALKETQEQSRQYLLQIEISGGTCKIKEADFCTGERENILRKPTIGLTWTTRELKWQVNNYKQAWFQLRIGLRKQGRTGMKANA